MKKIVILVLVIAAAGGGAWWWLGRGGSQQSVEAKATAKVERGPLRLFVACSGRVIANLDVDIKCKASGEVVKLPFDISEQCKKGDLLVELDPVDMQRVLRQAEVTLAGSQARLTIAKQNLASETRRVEAALKSAEVRASDTRSKADRMKQLLEKKLSSQEDYDTAETAAIQAAADVENAKARADDHVLFEQQVKLAENQVESDKIALTIAQDRLTDTRVLAPMDGVVAARNVQIGVIISSGVSNVGGGTTVLTLSDLSRIFVVAAVDESDIGRVKEGQAASVTADAYPGRKFEGKVVRIATRGVNVSNVVTFEVKIEIESENKSLLKPEMTTNVEIVKEEKDDVLQVPVEAVARSKDGQRTVTVQKDGGGTQEVAVKTGISDGTKTEIVEGLTEGQTVVYRKGSSDGRWGGGQQRGPGGMMVPGMGGPRR